MFVHRHGDEGDDNNDDNDNGNEQGVNSDEEIDDDTNENDNDSEEEDLLTKLSHLNSNGNNNDNGLLVQSRRLELELQHAYDSILNIVSTTTTTHGTAATTDTDNSRSINNSLQLSQLLDAQQSVLNLAFQQQQQLQQAATATATDASTDNSATRGTTPTLSSAAAALTKIDNNIQQEQLRYQQITMNGNNNQRQLSLHEILVKAIIAYDEQLNREVDELFPSLEQCRSNN